MADTGLEHRRVYGKKRQLLAKFACLIQHQMRVFERLPDTTLRSKIAPPTIFGPLVSMTCDAAADFQATSRNAAGSSTSGVGKTSPSARARRLSRRIRLIASLARPPSPISPM